MKAEGMPKEAQELYQELEKWSISKLSAKFNERIKDHLRANQITQDNLLK